MLNRNRGASDERDTVYAVWGLAENVSRRGIYGLNPGYSLDADEVYRIFTVEYLRSTRSLDLLAAISQHDSRSPC